MKHIEHLHQAALIEWAHRIRIPPALDIEPGATIAWYLLAIPNGGKRSPREGARLKAEGVKSGVSDLLLPLRRGGYCGLFLEQRRQGKDFRQSNSHGCSVWHWPATALSGGTTGRKPPT